MKDILPLHDRGKTLKVDRRRSFQCLVSLLPIAGLNPFRVGELTMHEVINLKKGIALETSLVPPRTPACYQKSWVVS